MYAALGDLDAATEALARVGAPRDDVDVPPPMVQAWLDVAAGGPVVEGITFHPAMLRFFAGP